MRRRSRRRDVEFEVLRYVLTRHVTLEDGRVYTHRCTREVFEEVAHTIEERGEEGVTMESLAKTIDAPKTQVNVALEFLKERGCVITPAGGGRRSYPASTFLYEDAMIEFLYFAEGI